MLLILEEKSIDNSQSSNNSNEENELERERKKQNTFLYAIIKKKKIPINTI